MADGSSQPNATKHQFSSFDPTGLKEATEQAKLKEYEKLLEAAAQLSSEESSEEGERGDGETSKSRVQQSKRKSKSHKSRARDAHLRPRDRKEYYRSKKSKKGGRREDWLATEEKERRKLVEAEERAGQKNRLRRGMLLPPGSDELRFEADSMGDYGNLAFGCPNVESVPKYSKGLEKRKLEKSWQPRQHRMHVERSEKVGFDDNEEFVGFPKDLVAKDTMICDDSDATRWNMLDEEKIIKETRRFNVETRKDPHNIDLWLEFANFQEDMVRYLKKRGSKVKLNALQKKISVLERGLSFNPDSDQLMLELLKCAERVRPPEEMEERWNKAVSYLHSSVDMWRAYVSRQRENRSSFDAMFVSQSYRSAILAMYRSYKMGEIEYYSDQKFQLAKDVVDITLECIQFHFECNMTEYAVSMIQAWLEYQYLSPKDWPEDAIEAMFQEFWSSGAPLIGEEGGEGWGKWLDSCQNAMEGPKKARNLQEKLGRDDRLISGPWEHLLKSTEDETNDNSVDIINENAMIRLSEHSDLEKQFTAEFDALMDRVEESPSIEILKTWIKMEDEKDSMHFLRASNVRSDQEQDNDSESDPSEKVDWHEILHCLMRIDQPESAQYSLLMGFLELLGVIRDPIPHYNVNLSDDLCLLDHGSIGTGYTLNTLKHWSWESLLPGAPGRSSLWWTKSLSRQMFCIRLLLTVSSCIQGPLQSILLSAGIVLASCDVTPPSIEHSNVTPIGSTKDDTLVKDILSRYSSMFSLWGMYAFLKAASGSFKAAKKIFRNCIKSNDGVWDMDSLYDRAQLCIFQAKSEILSTAMNHEDLLLQYPYCLLSLRKEQALNIIASHIWFASRGSILIETENLSDEIIIETKKKFQNLLSDLCRYGSQLPAFKTNLICTLEVAASFELLVPIARSEGPGILSAVYLYQHILSEVNERLTDARTIHDPLSFDISIQQQCSLAVFTSHSFPLLLSPGTARILTLEALSLWPGHPSFLRILSIHEQRSYNLNSLRREIGILIARSQHNPIMEYLSLIMAELKSGSSLSSVALLLERALRHTSCRACPLLWRLRVRLASQLETERQPLMNVFLRSIDACPWSKNVWMDGIDALYQSAQFSCKEIMDLVDVMREKDIIVRTDLYEALLAHLEHGL
eukprot:jgi/Picsp_1/5273/NSC_02635-R1_upf0614 protein c14orf102-like